MILDPDTLTIRTPRLLLRPLKPGDLFPLAEAANDPEVSRWTLTLPHPYGPGDAALWIVRSLELLVKGEALPMAVFLGQPLVAADGVCHAAGTMVASVGLMINVAGRRAELGYWVGAPFRKCGIAAEAARAVVDFGFAELQLARIFAGHFPGNESSAAVMRRCGMVRESVARSGALKQGKPLDVTIYAMTREDWSKAP